MKIGIINYGMGNIGSVESAFRFLQIETCILDKAADFDGVDGLILPGVGSFGRAMDNIRRRDLVAPMNDAVLAAEKPILAICLGMQLLANGSCESDGVEGLGWIDIQVDIVARDHRDDPAVRRPQVGWNSMAFKQPDHHLLRRITAEEMVYFDHGFAIPVDCEDALAHTDYYGGFTSMLARNNIFGAQFHPEKSQRTGLVMLRNFTNLVAGNSASHAA